MAKLHKSYVEQEKKDLASSVQWTNTKKDHINFITNKEDSNGR